MAVWLVRSGKHGEQESLALEKNLSVISFNRVPDLAPVKTREEMREFLSKIYQKATFNAISSWMGSLWAFRTQMQKGDLIVLPLHIQSAIAIGKIQGDYKYRADLPEGAHHTRPVKWLRTDIPRTAFDQDLLYTFGSARTVCQIQRNNAEERIIAVLEEKPLPHPKEEDEQDTEESMDLEEYARDQIRAFIGQEFTGHDFARLVDELLKAQGYKTNFSPPGPDRGVDIIAGCGPMGFDPPKLCVQVKSGTTPVDVGVLRELQGVMENFGAEQGLLVSWGGFRNNVLTEARHLFFKIRLWDAGELVSILFENYERLSANLRAELPLKRTWILVPEERGGAEGVNSEEL